MSGRARVLLIEPDDDLARLLLRVIRSTGPTRLDHARDAEQALLRATFTVYDVVVADFDLGPNAESGLSAIERLRRERFGPQSYILVSAVDHEVPDWCTLVAADDLTRLSTLISAWS
jgi:CheY-like chemotaxis protein